MPIYNLPNLLPNLLPKPQPAPTLQWAISKTSTQFYTPSLLVVLRGFKVAERSYLGFYGEVFSSASISDVQEGGFATVASR